MTADTFYQELKRVILSHPKRPAQVMNSENCEYGNYIYYSKNLYHCFDCGQCTDGARLFDTWQSANCVDCDYSKESERCFECVDANKCFNSNYLTYCQNVSDSYYSVDCTACHDIFGCVRLKSKSFCIFNRQLTQEEYREKVAKLKQLPPEKIFPIVNEILSKHPMTQTHEKQNENSPFGNYISYNRNSYLCFDATRNEFCGYLYDTSDNKYSYDITQSSHCEMSLEVTDSTLIFNCEYVIFSKNCIDSTYLVDCLNVKNSLGCVMLEHKQYCILNRQFSKEEYDRISKPLLAELRQKNLGWNDLIY